MPAIYTDSGHYICLKWIKGSTTQMITETHSTIYLIKTFWYFIRTRKKQINKLWLSMFFLKWFFIILHFLFVLVLILCFYGFLLKKLFQANVLGPSNLMNSFKWLNALFKMRVIDFILNSICFWNVRWLRVGEVWRRLPPLTNPSYHQMPR